MFKIEMNGQSLDLNPGQQITLEAESNLFTDTLKADGSELISLAITSRNLLALGHADVIEIEPQIETYSCLLTLGLNTYPATLRIQEVTATSINVYVLYNQAELSCLQLNCRDFNWSVNTAPFNDFQSQWDLVASNYWPDTPFYFPAILNTAFFDDETTSPANKREQYYSGIINRHELDNGVPVFTENFVDGVTGESKNINTAVPMIPLLEILKRGFETDNYRLVGSFVEHPAIRRLFLYNNKTINQAVSAFTDQVTATNTLGYVTTYNAQKLNFTSSTKQAVFNTTTDEYSIPATGTFAFSIQLGIGNITPSQPAVIQVYKQGVLLNEYAIAGGAINDGVYTVNFNLTFAAADVGNTLYFTIDGAFHPSGTSNLTNLVLDVERVYDKPLTNPAAITDLTDHAPDVLFSELLNNALKAFGLEMIINREQALVRLDFKRDKLSIKAPKNLTNATLNVTQEWLQKSAYSFKWGNSDSDELIDKSLIRQAVYDTNTGLIVESTEKKGLSAEAITTDFKLLEYATQTAAQATGFGQRALTIKQRGRADYHQDLTSAEGELLIGLYNYDYPFRLSSNVNSEIDLRLQANLFNVLQFHTPWLQWLQKSFRIFKVDVLPTHPQAQQLQTGDQVTVQNNTFLVQRITKTYTLNGLQKISLELRKV